MKTIGKILLFTGLSLFFCTDLYSQFNHQRYANQWIQKSNELGKELARDLQPSTRFAMRSTNKDIYVLYMDGKKTACFSDEWSCKSQINMIKLRFENLLESAVSGIPSSEISHSEKAELRREIKKMSNSMNLTYRKEANPNYRGDENVNQGNYSNSNNYNQSRYNSAANNSDNYSQSQSVIQPPNAGQSPKPSYTERIFTTETKKENKTTNTGRIAAVTPQADFGNELDQYFQKSGHQGGLDQNSTPIRKEDYPVLKAPSERPVIVESKHFNSGEVTVVESSIVRNVPSSNITNSPVPKPVNRQLSSNELAAGNDFGFGSPDDIMAHNKEVFDKLGAEYNAKIAKQKAEQSRIVIEGKRKERKVLRENWVNLNDFRKKLNDVKNVPGMETLKGDAIKQYDNSIKVGEELIDEYKKLFANETITPEEKRDMQRDIDEITKQIAKEKKEKEEIINMQPSNNLFEDEEE